MFCHKEHIHFKQENDSGPFVLLLSLDSTNSLSFTHYKMCIHEHARCTFSTKSTLQSVHHGNCKCLHSCVFSHAYSFSPLYHHAILGFDSTLLTLIYYITSSTGKYCYLPHNNICCNWEEWFSLCWCVTKRVACIEQSDNSVTQNVTTILNNIVHQLI